MFKKSGSTRTIRTIFNLWFVGISIIALFSSFASAQSEREAGRGVGPRTEIENDIDKALPPPEATVIDRSDRSVLDAVRKHVMTMPVKASSPNAVGNSDVFAYAMQRLGEFAELKGDFAQYKGLERGVFARIYGFNDKAAQNFMDAAAQMQQFVVVTEADNAMDGKFASKEEPFNFDFASAKWKNNGQARGIQKMLANGFTQASPQNPKRTDKMIVMDPLNNPADKENDPLMHEKEFVFFVKKPDGSIEVVDYISQTANGNEGDRHNRGLELDIPELGKKAYEHTLKMVDAFIDGKPIHEIEGGGATVVKFKDGLVGQAWTDGKYDWNQRIVDRLNQVERGELQIEHLLLSEFVFTTGKVRTALINALKADIERAKTEGRQPFRVTLAIEGKFAESRQANLASTLVGIPNAMGGFEPGEPAKFFTWQAPAAALKQITVYVHQRPVEGVPVVNPDGVPNHYFLQHDKTAVFVSKETVYIETGSFNLSNNFHSAETRIFLEVPRTSWIGQSFESSITELIKDKYFIRGEKGFARMSLSRLIEHSWFEIPFEFEGKPVMENLLDLLGVNDWKDGQKPRMNLAEAKELMLSL
ncbi:MAG: hypothetical protein ABL958_11750, partial [Bdellovibrionia bacterium]